MSWQSTKGPMLRVMAELDQVLKVEDLVSTKSLDVTVLAGAEGLAREVFWAHSCELPDPERWLDPHELLMTVGLCVPSDASAQVAFIRRLDEARLAGLMIGDHETAPQLTGEMLAEADRRAFPVLLAATHTPYAVVARHVAAANTSAQILQVLKLGKLYHLAANASVEDDAQELVRSMSILLGVDISVRDRATGMTIIEMEHPTRARPDVAPRVYPLRGAHPADLLLAEYPGEELDSLLLVHLLKVLEVSVDRVLTAAERRSEQSARALRSLLNGTRPEDVDLLLAAHHVSEGFRVAAVPSADGEHIARLIALRGLPVLVTGGRRNHFTLFPVAVERMMREVAEQTGISAGVSSVFADYQDVPIAADEAARTLRAAQHSAGGWTEFKGTTISVLSRSRREADEIITGVLGSLSDSTEASRKLRDTLFAYLRNDRRWEPTAHELGIHRQTLSYRLNKIGAETGLSLSKSADLSALWIAFQAWEATRGTEDDASA